MTEDKTEEPSSEGSAPADSEARPTDAAAADPAPAASVETPEARATRLEAEKDEMRNRMLRIAADFDNWKKRSRKEQSDAEARARESVLRDMLEIVDNLERASAAATDATDAASVQRGVDLVLRLFVARLERHDVRAFDAVGQSFDPRVHEAISQVESAAAAPGSVVSQMQKGYKLADRLLRPAMVTVAVAPKEAAAEVEVEVEGDKGAAGSEPSEGGAS